MKSNALMPLGGGFMIRDYAGASFAVCEVKGDQIQASLYYTIVHLYFCSPRSKDTVKQVHLEASL